MRTHAHTHTHTYMYIKSHVTAENPSYGTHCYKNLSQAGMPFTRICLKCILVWLGLTHTIHANTATLSGIYPKVWLPSMTVSTNYFHNRKLLNQQWWQLCYLLVTSKFRTISQAVCSIHAIHTRAPTNFINMTLIYSQVWSDRINLTAWNIRRLVDKQVISRVNRNQSLHKVVKVWSQWFLIKNNIRMTI